MTAFLWDLLSAAAIVGASWFVGGWIAGIVGSLLAQTRVDPMVRALLVRLTKPLVIGAAIVAALSQVGVDIRVLLAILAAGAIAVGLGLQGPVASLISGGILFSRRPFRVGDTVELAGIEGTVAGIGWLSVLIDETDGSRVILPNRMVTAHPMRIRPTEP
ncbi:MAG: mechanosensitive ion channel domain-containing protein [Myxococcota bacterium]|nr:mechanosensitive ion channel domain-containing protein [Myxococcota bacterium]